VAGGRRSAPSRPTSAQRAQPAPGHGGFGKGWTQDAGHQGSRYFGSTWALAADNISLERRDYGAASRRDRRAARKADERVDRTNAEEAAEIGSAGDV